MNISRILHLLITAGSVAACLTPSAAFAQTDNTVRHVAARIPVVGLDSQILGSCGRLPRASIQLCRINTAAI